MDCAIDDYWLRVLQNTTIEEVTTCMTLCLGDTEVGGIRANIEDLVRSPIFYFCIRVHPHVVKELDHMRKGFFSWALFCAAIADNAMRMVGLTACA